MTEKNYTKPELRNRIKSQVMASGDGGKPGQWSARKAQLVAQKYEAAGGGYKGPRTGAQKSLAKWTDQKWTTSDGKPAEKPDGTMRRYLPEKAWDKLTPGQKAATNKKKVEASRKGQQFVANTDAAQEARKEAGMNTMFQKLALLAKHKNPEGGLTEAGRRHFERSGESKDLKPGVKKPVDEMSTKDMKRKGSWARRFYGQSPLPPLKKPNGEPTRLALTAKAWGEPVPQNEQQARAIAAKGTRLLEMAKRQEGQKSAADVGGFKITTDLSDVHKKLKPGDIVVTSMGRPLTEGSLLDRAKDKVFRTFSYSVNKDHAHTGIYVGKGQVVEMLNDKLHTRPLAKTVEGLDALVVRPQVDTKTRQEAVRRSVELAAKGDKFKYENFPFFAQVYLAEKAGLKPSTELNKRIDKNTVMCSNFIAHAYKDVNFNPQKIRAVIMPKDLAKSDKTKRVVLFQNPERHDAHRRLKAAAASKHLFAPLADRVLEEVRREEQGEVEENDPVSPYRDSQLSRALYSEKNRTPNADKPPRAEYARQPMYTKSAGLNRAATGALAAYRREKFQEELARHLEPSRDYEVEGTEIAIRRPDSIIPGSTYLRPARGHGTAGIAHRVLPKYVMSKPEQYKDLDHVDLEEALGTVSRSEYGV
jgi:uncharacterized protein YycO